MQVSPTRYTILLNIFISLSTFFGHPCAHHRDKITVSISMRHWYLSLCMGGVWSAGWIENSTSRPEANLLNIFIFLLYSSLLYITILLNIFIYILYMFRASMCTSSGENYCIYATLVFVTLYGWRLVCWLD